MKNFVLMALGAVAMVSCAQNEENLLNNEPVEIRLNAEIASSVGTRAAINKGDAVTNVQFARIDGETPDWTTIDVIELTGNVDASGKIAFTPIPHYLSTGEKANLLAYYPAAQTLADGIASMKIKGDEDVMYAAPVGGTKLVPITDKVQLKHLLTQFSFVVKREIASTPGDINDVAIAINDANTTFNMALATGTLLAWADPVNTIKPMTAGVATEAGSTATSGIMLEPDMPSIKLLVSADGYTEQTITINGTDGGVFEAGKSYTITLTFKGSAIDPSAAIEEWTPGTGGSEDIQ